MNVITIRPRAIFGPYDRAILPRILQNEKTVSYLLLGMEKIESILPMSKM